MKKIIIFFVALIFVGCSGKKSESSVINVGNSVQEEYPIDLTQVLNSETFIQPDDSLFEVEQLKNNDLKITNYLGNDKNIIIPSKLFDLNVTSIGENAFFNKGITGIIMPNSIELIESTIFAEGAFAQNNLTYLVLSKKLVSIGNYAFYDNPILKEVVIPDTTLYIGNKAFEGCGLTTVVLGSRLEQIGSEAFAFNVFEDITFPSSLKIIYKEAFRETPLKKVIIPNGVINIEARAFHDSVLEVVIPQSLSKYQNDSVKGNIAGFQGAFKDPRNIIQITLPANVDLNNFTTAPFSPSPSFETGFINYYINQNKKAGLYKKNGSIWNLE